MTVIGPLTGHTCRGYLGYCGTHSSDRSSQPGFLLRVCLDVVVEDGKVVLGLGVYVFDQNISFVYAMEIFHCLLQADGDEQAEDDGRDVNEEVSPGGGGVVSGMDVEHGLGSRRNGCVTSNCMRIPLMTMKLS